MKIYGLKNCDACRKAVKATGAELVDVRAAPLDRATLERFQAAFGAALLNTRSTTWRGLPEEARAGDPLALIAAHPALMKRPVIEADDGTLHLGWGKDVQAALGA
ncbi:ArsC/Spx/MgsR family protein [Rhodovulum sp. DZ06]|uniref:ArsC/Spx/MgsR family protein n=1 Tax=Rhodovulum sp. DZ06 TaxID=3425126 RepID=UPI003D340C42